MDKSSDKLSVLIAVTLVSFLSPFMGSSINIALPQIGSEFAMDAISLSWIATAFLLTVTILVLPFGKIADIYGRKKILAWGTIIFTAASFLLAISNSAAMLIYLRCIQGAGSALTFSTQIAILTSAFPASERGKVIGLSIGATYFGLSLGPFLGGILTEYCGWRSIFLFIAIVGLVAVILIFGKMKGEWAEAQGEKFDIVGSLLYSLMVITIVYGLTHLPGITGFVLISIGIVGLIAFIAWELRIKTPVLDINLFRRNRVFAFSCIAALINYSAAFAMGFLLSLYLQYIKGFSPRDAGFVLVVQPVIQVIFAPLAGRASDRIQPRLVASAGMACTSIGLLLLVFLDNQTSITWIIIASVLLGFGFALFSSPNTNAAMSVVDKKFYGVASGVIATMRNLGMIVSMGVVTLLFALYLGEVQITPEYYGVFLQCSSIAFIIFAAFCFLGIFASLTRGKVDESNREVHGKVSVENQH
jgi:EmrB/QacA subfamily drug resistance transporter